MDDDFNPILVTRDDQAIVGVNGPRSFHALAVHMHQSAVHRVGRLRSTFEEARAPEPLVDAERGNLCRFIGHVEILNAKSTHFKCEVVTR